MGGSFVLELDTTVATDCAAACVELISQFDAIRRYVELTEKVKGIGNLASGDQLEQKFDEKVKQLGITLGKHIAFVTSMGDKFIAAGKAYADTEIVSAHDLKALTDISLKPDPSRHISLPKRTGLTGAGERPATPPGLAPTDRMGKDGPSISAHDGDSLGWAALVAYQKESDMNPVMTVSDVFAEAKKRISEETEKVRKMIASTEGRWRGNGADGARQLAEDYAETVEKMVTSLDLVSVNAKYTADWVGYLKTALAPMLDVTDGALQEKLLPDYRKTFTAAYVPGIETADRSFPRIPQPPAAGGTGKTGGGGPNDGSKDGKGGGKDDGTKGGPGKGGGGSEGSPGPGPGSKGGGEEKGGAPGPGEGSKPPSKPDPSKPDPSKPKPEVPKPDPTQPKPEVPKPGLPGQPNPNVPGGNVPGLGPQVPNLLAPLITALGQGVQMFGQMVQAGVQADAALKAALPGLKLPEGVGPGPGEPPKDGGPNGKGTPPAKPGLAELKAKAFPRASIPGRAGEVLMPPMPFGPGAGMPVMPPGGAGHNSSVQAQSAKPAKFLDEPFLEEFGIEPDAVLPVIES